MAQTRATAARRLGPWWSFGTGRLPRISAGSRVWVWVHRSRVGVQDFWESFLLRNYNPLSTIPRRHFIGTDILRKFRHRHSRRCPHTEDIRHRLKPAVCIPTDMRRRTNLGLHPSIRREDRKANCCNHHLLHSNERSHQVEASFLFSWLNLTSRYANQMFQRRPPEQTRRESTLVAPHRPQETVI
jgi:hypothetical protein